MVAAARALGLDIPLTRMGAVTSEDLFEPREQVLFEFYARHAGRYRRALDIGANIGVHTLLMVRAGWEVRAYEPDPWHFRILMDNCAANGAKPAFLAQQAVSDRPGVATFVRVLGNTTSSHLKGDKTPYGEIEEFPVELVDCRPLFAWADLAKIDAEGHEARLLLAATPSHRCDFLVEVGSSQNAEAIFGHFHGERPLWAHRGDAWAPVRGLADMPAHYTHGTLFVGEAP